MSVYIRCYLWMSCAVAVNQSVNIFNSRLEAHAQQHITVQLNTMKIKKEYSANGLELVKERTSPMPMQCWQESYH